jgi:pimeloyl-ACP methyl ester carboxylesterase
LKFLLLIRRIALYSIFIILLFSCTRKEDEVPPVPDEPWKYLVDTVSLEGISITLIKATIQMAGYPQFNKYIKNSIKLYKITYNTTYKGNQILASGIISFPLFQTDSFPTMIVGNGLIFADEDAPSAFDLPENYTGFEFIASMGYFTLVPDMIGFGESKDLLFPIQNYEHSSGTMIDFIFAAEEFRKSKKLPVNNKKFLTGYSQGGYIAMATLKKIEDNPDLGIHIDATAVGAGGFNLVSLLDHIMSENTYSAPSHLALLFSSYTIMYDWNRPLTDFFQEPYASEIPYLIDGRYNREEIDSHLAYSFDSLLNPEFVQNIKNHNEPELFAALEENSVYNWAPKSPLRIVHSLYDDRIPFTESEETYKIMVANGSTSVKLVPIMTEGHINSGGEFVEIVMKWFNSFW